MRAPIACLPFHLRWRPRSTSISRTLGSTRHMTRLTKQESEELCLTGGIPNGHCDRFVRAVERCVATYRRLRERKSAPAVGAELAQVEKCIRRALGLVDRATWRPGEFHAVLEDISARLRKLSPAAREYLEFRNLTIRQDVILSPGRNRVIPMPSSIPFASLIGTIKFLPCGTHSEPSPAR